MRAQRIATLALAPVLSLALIACPAPEEREDVETTTEDVWEDVTPDERGTEFSIDEMRDSGVDGSVRMTGTAQTVTMAIALDDVEEQHRGQQFTAVLHMGDCEQPGQAVTELTTVRAMETDDGLLEGDDPTATGEDETTARQDTRTGTATAADTARATLSMQDLQPGQQYAVLIHDMQNQPVACGELPEDWQDEVGDGAMRDDMDRDATMGDDPTADTLP